MGAAKKQATGVERCGPGFTSRIACVMMGLAVAACFDPPARQARSGSGSEDPDWREPPEEIPPSFGGQDGPDSPGWSDLVDPPSASEHYVFEVSPLSGTIAVIDARSLQVQTLHTGDRPAYLTPVPELDAAVVINVGSEDASLISVIQGVATSTNFDVVDGANTIAMAPDGHHAVVFFDADKFGQGEEFGDFQSISVLSLGEGEALVHPVTVGFKPSRVLFQSDGRRAFVVTDEGISVLDFGLIESERGGIAPLIPLTRTLGGEVNDISITPDGTYALRFIFSRSVFGLIDLSAATEVLIDVTPLFLTDHDSNPQTPTVLPHGSVRIEYLVLAPSGDFAMAVVPVYNQLLRIPVTGVVGDLSSITQYPQPGRVDAMAFVPETSLVVAYPTWDDFQEELYVTDLATPTDTPRTVALRKIVQSVHLAPDGSTALIIHRKLPGQPDIDGLDIETRIDRSYGYSLVRPQTGDVRLQLTAAMPEHATFAPDSTFAFLTVSDNEAKSFEVHRLDLDHFSLGPLIKLDSAATALGAVPSQGSVFVSTDHPDGRITFVEWASGDVTTVTGFEINSQIRD